MNLNHSFFKNFTILVSCILLIFTSCKQNNSNSDSDYSLFSSYISGYTSGIISSNSTIKVELATPVEIVDLSEAIEGSPLSFSPSIKGKAFWANNSTIEFHPDKGELTPGKEYKVTFKLGDFVKVDSKCKKFEFSFKVKEKQVNFIVDPINTISNEKAEIVGKIFFSDVVEGVESIPNLVYATGNGNNYNGVISKDEFGNYNFVIANIVRGSEDYDLTIKVDGTKIGSSDIKEKTITIPNSSSFSALSVMRISEPENGVVVTFSSQIMQDQNLNGLIQIPEIRNFSTEIIGNKINVYFVAKTDKPFTVKVNAGIKDIYKNRLSKPLIVSFASIAEKPKVELLSDALILPNSENLILPFKAVGLYAVDLCIVKIYTNNILQFLQENSLSGSSELRRWGRLIHKQRLVLGTSNNEKIKNLTDYSVDLSKLIKNEPGAMYRAYLSFGMDYSAYPCNGVEKTEVSFSENQVLYDEKSADISDNEWDKPYSYFYYNPGVERNWSLYEWEERDNPCHISYYMEDSRVASCNILASNIGVIAKKNSANKMWVIANDILTTQPISGANVTIYNYQLQKLASATTNSDGISVIECKGVPFIVEVESNNQRSFVKVLDGESQSLSRFDVGGKKIEKGLKGFIYGERGVWRPGDTLNVTFILDTKHSNIPDNHPVTFTLYNPNGQFYTKKVATQGVNGFYAFKIATNSEDPTGLWNGYVSVGGVSFYKGFRIETIKPNRLKINLNLPPVIRSANGVTNIKLNSMWLTGVNASNLKAKVEVALTKTKTQFKNYSNYTFNNPCSDFGTSTLNIFEGQLDANGEKIIPFNTPSASDAPGMLNAKFTTQVYEPGGNASISVATVPYSPFRTYVGVNFNAPDNKILETDKLHTFNVVTLDSDGNLTDNNSLEYKIYKVDWNWWWENRDESFSKYINNTSYVPEASGRLTTVNGKANITFKVDYPSWGRYFVYVYDRSGGHASGGTVYIDWPSYRGRSSKQDPSGEKMLTFSLDKKEYKVGDKATAYIPTAADGAALISFENGSTILKQEWVKVSSKEDTKYTFDITEDMVPNAYLSVTLLQPHTQSVNNLPIRMYGVVPIIAKDNNTILKPVISMPEVIRPEEEFEVVVNEESGKEMTYTLAIVDEGLLDLTNYVTPNPWDEFYRKEALDITTWDMYDYVFGATNGSFAALYSVGGDEQLKPSEAKANRFKPVVKFVGPVTIKKGDKGKHKIKLPMYLGAVKAMVVAGGNGAYGKAEKSAFVKTPLMLQTTLPRVLSVNEEILVPVNVFAMEKNIRNVNVSIKVSGDGVVVDGDEKQTLTFNEPGDNLIYFKLKTTDKVGIAKINVSANSGSNKTFENVEIDVRNPNPIVTLYETKWVEAGKEASLPYSFVGSSESRSMKLDVMRIPSINFSERMNFLYDYQHNCTEQITSKALPLLFVDKFTEVTKSEQENINKNITNAINMLYSRQLNNGGFVYWPSSSVADEWISSYVGMFLTLAKEKGYSVNKGVISKWQSFQKSAVNNWKNTTNNGYYYSFESAYIQAFRLYSLALAGSPEIGAMNRMNVIKDLPLQAKWRLAAAYAVAGKKSIANELIFSTTSDVSPYNSENSIYGSKSRDEAMILETLLLLDRTEQAVKLAKQIAETLNKEKYYTTQTTAFTLYAMSYLADKTQGSLKFEYQLDNGKREKVSSAKTILSSNLSPKQESGVVEIKNKGEQGVFVELISKVHLLNDTLPSMSNNLRMNVKYVTLNGSPIDITNLKQGDEFKAVIEVANIGLQNYTNLALIHIVPAGWEIFNQDLFSAASSNTGYTYRDIRDDRVLTYFDLRKNTSKQFEVRLQATYLGDFNLPPIQCEAMYDSSVSARLKGGRTTVKR